MDQARLMHVLERLQQVRSEGLKKVDFQSAKPAQADSEGLGLGIAAAGAGGFGESGFCGGGGVKIGRKP